MIALQAYLASPKVRRALRTKPGQKGFSLIELVVVIAILGILIAIALPNFLGVQKDAQVNQAKNALATIIKECAVKGTRYENTQLGTVGAAGPAGVVQAANGNIKGYTLVRNQQAAIVAGSATTPVAPATWTPLDLGAAGTAGADSGASCYSVQAMSDGANLPHFSIAYNGTTGETDKVCHVETTSTYAQGCDGVTQGSTGVGTW